MLEFYKNKRVFVTGHTGFKGSWLCAALLQLGAEVTGFALAPDKEENLYGISGIQGKINSHIGDIRDFELLSKAFYTAKPEVVFHLAAQPLVMESYENPLYTYHVNVMGTVHILECMRTSKSSVQSFVNITTDKVYQNVEQSQGYKEDDRLDGYDPYSNSKSCSELVTAAYKRSFFGDGGTVISTCRAGNVIGGGDFSDNRIIPDCIRAATAGETIRVRNPYSVRPYQHVLEPVFAYLYLAKEQCENRKLAGCYNIGPNEEDSITTEQLVAIFCRIWGPGAAWEKANMAKAVHEAGLLKLDCSKVKTTLGWRPRWNVEQAVEKTIEWTKAHYTAQDGADIMHRQIAEYRSTYMGEK